MSQPFQMINTATEGPRKAYSYRRFSTPEQALGDSYRRQTVLAQRYCESHGLELDAELHFDDKGVSAFRGQNASAGALAAFKQAVSDGTVPQGSYLIVESLDRISRQTARKAARTLEAIVEAGVSVVDLSDSGRVYDTDTLDDPLAFIMMALRFARAHEESATKSMRLQNAYEQKRKVAASGEPQTKPFTLMLPAWLRWNSDTKRYEAIEERAAILIDIFAKADDGWSKHRIARALNEAGTETWGAGRKGQHWHSSYVQKLMTNAAVIGTFTPHRVIRVDGGSRKRIPQDPIKNFYPAVIDPDVFARVSAQAMARSARGRHADNAPKSIFAGLLRCGVCGGSVVRVAKGQRDVYLVCSKAHQRAGCKYQAVRYENAEEPFIDRLRSLDDWAPRGKNTAQIEAEIEQLANNIEGGQDIAEGLLDEVVNEKSETARRRLKELEEELARDERELRTLRARRDATASPVVVRRLNAIQQAATKVAASIPEINKALRQAVSKIVFDAEQGELIVWWHHADAPSDPIYFVSRHDTRWHGP